jgi:hypothetical protein
MGVSRTIHRGRPASPAPYPQGKFVSHGTRCPNYAAYPQGKFELQRSRSSSRNPSSTRSSSTKKRWGSSIPAGLCFYEWLKTFPDLSQDEAREIFMAHFCAETEPQEATRRSASPTEINGYLDLLYGDGMQTRLSNLIKSEAVLADRYRRRYHWGEEAARQYDLTLPYVIEILRHMWEKFDTVSCYSLGMLELGMIIYYLEPYALGLDQKSQGCGTATVGGRRFEARVHLKGRFGIVVDKYAQSLKVAEIYTFGGQGLGTKNPKTWHEYVGLRDAEVKDFYNTSPHKALEVANSCCEIPPTSSVHLVTGKVTLNSQILCAGRITPDSLDRLRIMIRNMESC